MKGRHVLIKKEKAREKLDKMQKHRNINIESHSSFQKFKNKEEKTRQNDQKFRKNRKNCQFSVIEKIKFAKKVVKLT